MASTFTHKAWSFAQFFFVVGMSSVGGAALAHPSGDGPLSQIGVETRLEVLRDVNVPPQTSSIWLTKYESVGGVDCTLFVFKESDHDRVLKKGTSLKIVRVESHPSVNYVRIDLDRQEMKLVCGPGNMTLEQFERAVQNTFKIQLAEPETI